MKLSAKCFMFLAGAVVGGILSLAFIEVSLSNQEEKVIDDKAPLYWVAPMDSNYRRDKPGKSPMGMDLVPVFNDEGKDDLGHKGVVKIKPHVVNNLGVRSALVEKREVTTEIKTVGYVKYDEDLITHIHPRVEGWIDKLYVKAQGDPLKKGQPLYELYSPALVSAQEELILAMSRKNQQLIQAAVSRLRSLQIPSSLIRDLQETRKVSPTITFYSPRQGVVDNLNIREGFYVKPGTMLMSIGGLSQVWVEAEIFERQVPFVRIGMPVSMHLEFLPGRLWQGRVDFIYPTLDAKTRTVKLRLKFNNENDLLKPNMFAQVLIKAKSDYQALMVPKQAVIRSGEIDRVVLDLDNGEYKSVAVRLGLHESNYIEILEGVAEGEKIVTSAQFLIDSESSKTSDFLRMQPVTHEIITPSNQVESAQVSGIINIIDVHRRLINITHEPIMKWNRPSMSMDFKLSPAIDMQTLNEGEGVDFEFEVRDHDFVITKIEIIVASDSAESNHD